MREARDNRRLLAVLFCLVLLGCAANQFVWDHPTAGDGNFARDRARCDYETSAATTTPDYSYRSIVGQSLDQALRKNELFGKCMMAAGYYRRPN